MRLAVTKKHNNSKSYVISVNILISLYIEQILTSFKFCSTFILLTESGMAAIVTKPWLVPYTDCLIITFNISECTSTLREKYASCVSPKVVSRLILQIYNDFFLDA